MKTKIFLSLFLICYTLQLFAQNPLVGTWELQADTFRTLKITTPTHWMFITEDNKTKKFKSAAAGTYTKKRNKYIPAS
jgi:membrane-bound acyltransferase YfiQ involved in biofilm formation